MNKLRFLSEGLQLISFCFYKIFSRFKLILKVTGALLVLASIYLAGGCNYMMVNSTDYPSAASLQDEFNKNKAFIIHTTNAVFHIDKLMIQNDSIKGKYLMMYKMPYKTSEFPDVNSRARFNRSKDQKLLSEVHLYVPFDKFSSTELNSYSVKDIYRFDIYTFDKGATTASYIFGTIGFIAGGLALFIGAVFLVAMISGSCPYVYVNNGTDYVLTGDIYSGAVYAPLERNDYLKLPGLVAEDGLYKLMIANELEEVQFNNFTELITIDHPGNTSVLIDKYGNYQSFCNLQKPTKAVNSNGTDIRSFIEARDSLTYIGPLDVSDIPAIDRLELSFNIPENAKTAKLLINARNSNWLEYMYKNIGDLLGSYGPEWREKQNGAEKDRLIKSMIDQKLPLAVYIERNGEWVFYDYFNMIGPLMMRDDVIPIDLKGFTGKQLKIKLETGSFFWQINYAAIDFSENVAVASKNIMIDKGITDNEEDVTALLKYDDLKYYVQEKVFESAELRFPVPDMKQDSRTVFLHSKGYYQQNYTGSGLPRISKLRKLQKPGQFPEFSKQLLYSEIEKMTGKPR